MHLHVCQHCSLETARSDMSRIMTKPTKWPVRPAKPQISLDIHSVWSESSLCAHWVAKDPSFLQADSEDSDQTGRMPRLIWVFAGCTGHFVGFVMMRLIYQDTVADTTGDKELLSICPSSWCRARELGRIRSWYSGGHGFDPSVRQHFSWRLVVKSFLRPFSPYRWFR